MESPHPRKLYHKLKQSGYQIWSDPKNGESGPEEEFDPDIIIVGAGVAGAALAYTLGKDGRRVRVIERDLSEPDRIVGEVLQPGGYLKLLELGLQDCVENIDAQRMIGYAIFKDGKRAKLPYPLEKFNSDVAGRGFHNGRFVQKMREKAATLPNIKPKLAKSCIACDGCFSNLRRSLCNPKVDVLSSSVGLILEHCKLPFPNHGHAILADPSPFLFYSISSTETRCLVDIPAGQKLPSLANGDMAKYLKRVVAPQVPPELHDAFISAVDRGNIRTMRNGSMPATPCPKPGALMIGDAFNMRHALTGGGMMMALSDIVVLQNILRNLRDLKDTDLLSKHLESFYTLRKPVAFTINTMAGALYKVSSASADQARKEMHEAVFDYLSIGGVFAKGPVSLLSGLNLRPMSLLLHFSAAGIYGVGRLLIPFPTPKRLWSVVRLISNHDIKLPSLRPTLADTSFSRAHQDKSVERVHVFLLEISV
ncbi:hypothetical protein DH2020_048866 [Rehmannia glutinosa]|uniref:Squalene monooxygenase n=1 Tax=Rehmannia glutinosa TaxID=99300 RepID=A0ABR0U4J1_REHGL